MRKLTVIVILLLLQSCGSVGRWESFTARLDKLKAKNDAAALVEGQNQKKTTRPLTKTERVVIVRATLRQSRDPSSTQIKFDGTSYERHGKRVVDFLLKGRNGFGGLTGFVRYRATFDDTGRLRVIDKAVF